MTVRELVAGEVMSVGEAHTLREAVRLMQNELMRQQAALQTANPAQAQQIQGNIAALKRQIIAMSGNVATDAKAAGSSPAPMTAPSAPAAPSMGAGPTGGAPQAPTGIDQGLVGKSMALAQNNMPVNLLANFVHQYKKQFPNATPDQLYFAVNSANPTLVNQANSAAKLAGLGIDSLFKGLTTWADLQNAQTHAVDANTRARQLPSTIARNTAMANYYNQAIGAGIPSAGGMGPASGGSPGQAPVPYNDALAYLNGTLGSTGGPVGVGRQNRAYAELDAMGLTPAVQKPYQNDLMAAKTAASQLQQRASTLQATSSALDAQLGQAIQDAKQLNLNGPVVWNKGKLTVGGQAIPTDSPIYQTFQHYDALVADAAREAGAQQMFGKATVAGLKNGAAIVAADKGEGLAGVLNGLRDGAQSSVQAINHTLAITNVGPVLRLISQSSKPDVAATQFGFTPISIKTLDAYAKQHDISRDSAAMVLSLNPSKPYFVVGYPYGR